MPYEHSKINLLEGGWYAVYDNGYVITEQEGPWLKVSKKKNIKLVGLKWRHKRHELDSSVLRNFKGFIPPGETQMREISVSNGKEVQITRQTVVGRFIGYYEADKKIKIYVDLKTGKFTREEIYYNEDNQDSQT